MSAPPHHTLFAPIIASFTRRSNEEAILKFTLYFEPFSIARPSCFNWTFQSSVPAFVISYRALFPVKATVALAPPFS